MAKNIFEPNLRGGNNRAFFWARRKNSVKTKLFFKKGLQKRKNCLSLPCFLSQARRDG